MRKFPNLMALISCNLIASVFSISVELATMVTVLSDLLLLNVRQTTYFEFKKKTR